MAVADIDPEQHRAAGIVANNSIWDLLGEPASPERDEELLRRAYAAAYHWARAEGTGPANEARAEWLLARVWVARGNGTLARGHAEHCLSVCDSHGLVDFDLAYAHEAMARALACCGDTAGARTAFDRALQLAIAQNHEGPQAELQQLLADLK